MKEIKGNFCGKGKRILIVISRFNEFISNQLLQGCLDSLTKGGAAAENVTVVWTPGAFEIPQVLNKINTADFDGAIALGAVIRGDTPHFDYIAAEVSKGVAKLSLEKNIPVIFGVITADTVEQAMERAGIKQGNKGREAALSVLEMIDIYSQI